MSKFAHSIQRIQINRDGYDDSGGYWGAGPDAFIATSPDGADEITVRARTLKEAKQKIAAEDVRASDAPRLTADRLGGKAPRKTHYDIVWTNPVTTETVTIRITHSRDYLASGSDHIEVESVSPKKAPLPITETGYRSQFLKSLELINAGGPVPFIEAWIAQEAKGKAWTKTAHARAQGDLFSWAEAQGEVGKPKRAVTPRRHDGRPSRRQTTPKSAPK